MRDFFISPARAHAGTPSLVLVMHLGGVDRSMRDTAQQFAESGFAVYVPDLYHRFDAPEPDSDPNVQAFLPYAKQLTTQTINEDLLRAAGELRARFPHTRTGIIGFCMGGRIAMLRASGFSDTFSAAAIWYGFAEEMDTSTIDIPIVGSFGADDHFIPTAAVVAAFEKIPVENDVKVYAGAQHGFFHEEAAHDAEAAADSFARSADFLRRYLLPAWSSSN